jgi:hypothetical protein
MVFLLEMAMTWCVTLFPPNGPDVHDSMSQMRLNMVIFVKGAVLVWWRS